VSEQLMQGAKAWADRLRDLGTAVRDAVCAAQRSGDELAEPVAQEGGDTIFAIDRHVEPVIERAVEQWPDECKPLRIVAEGLGESGERTFAGGSNTDGEPWCVIIDPIDGTRNIMYDKRAAWFIAAAAPDRGAQTTLKDAIASVMVELPTSKAAWADVFAATVNGGVEARRTPLNGKDNPHAVTLRPSTAPSLAQGFAQVSNFFPGTKTLASELMERIVTATLGDVTPGSAAVFDDQYITTAGQMVELMLGHDRFCCDLRPLFYEALAKQSGNSVRGLECHPYDVAGALVAQRAGVVLTDGFGRPLDAPLDVTSPVHWCGYANQTLRGQIEPVIQTWLREKEVEPS